MSAFSSTSTSSNNNNDTTSPTEIPTLTQLYAEEHLPLPQSTFFPHDAKLNERVSIWKGDITKLSADMVVNAANKSLLGGGGVDGAIHSAAGPDLLKECRDLGGAQTGETKTTWGYNLPSTRIAHTVGPIYSRSNHDTSERLLSSCYRTSLERCKEHGGGVIGFSSISTGIYGYPVTEACHTALETTRKFLEQDTTIDRVIYVVFSQKDYETYRHAVPNFFPPPNAPEPER